MKITCENESSGEKIVINFFDYSITRFVEMFRLIMGWYGYLPVTCEKFLLTEEDEAKLEDE